MSIAAFVPPAPIDDEVIVIAQLVGGVVFGIICAALAPGRGRSAVGWFFIGFVGGCIGILLVLLLPNLKEQEAKQRRQRAETRKLREQLKTERQVADERHEAHDTRLSAHDRALGLDTAQREMLPSSTPPRLPPPLERAEWFYGVEGQRQGPVTASHLRTLWLDEKIPDQTLVWRDGMRDWLPIEEVADVLGGKDA